MLAGLPNLCAWGLRQVATLDPGCFAIAMATGIISTALWFDTYHAASNALFIIESLTYAWLATLTAVRIIRFGRLVWQDLADPGTVFSVFTIVAASNVLGVGISLRGFTSVASAFWLLALSLWFVLIYFGFGVMMLGRGAQRVDIVRGAWLMAIVGTQSLVLLGVRTAPSLGTLGSAAFLLVHMLWGLGLCLYGIFIALFAHRIFFTKIMPCDVTPVLWIVMGAAAISTDAGIAIGTSDSNIIYLHSLRPFIDGVTIVTWAWATWWIPLLVMLGVWKHGFCRVPLSYHISMWSMVFPLGMYSLATARLSLEAGLTHLQALSRAMLWIAIVALVSTAAGLVSASRRSLREFDGHAG